MDEERICAMCGQTYDEFPATSRINSTTEICSSCGWWEATHNGIVSKVVSTYGRDTFAFRTLKIMFDFERKNISE